MSRAQPQSSFLIDRSRHACAWLMFFWALLAPHRAGAQPVTVPRLTAPPQLADFAGSPEPPIAKQMVAVRGLVQRTPVDGDPVSEPTVVYLGYDPQHLYAVFVCATESGGVRARRVNRDRLPDDDDSVALHLDTFRDRRRLYGFQVNPAGVQVDGVYTEGQGWDLSFDTVWTAETLVRREQYLVLITIPFSSLRFPSTTEQEWGLFVYRGIPRKNEEAFWPAYSTRNQGRLAYAAPLRGLRELDPRQTAQLIPYGTFRAERFGGTNDQPGSVVEQQLRAGLDAKAVLRDSLVLDLTANPDFSHVESDEPQTTVNERFEVFFPEKRPFFIENASYFETAIPVLFSRRIRDPRIGARLTGKVGRYAIGALVTDDTAAPGSPPQAESDSRALTSAFRVSRDLGAESQVGLFYGGRRDPAFDNHVGGVDGRWRLTRNWVATAQTLASRHTLSNADGRAGAALRAGLDGSGHHYAYRFTFVDISPGFHASTGFVPRTDIRELTQTANATLRPARKGIVAWTPSVTVTRIWDHSQTPLETRARLESSIELRRSSRVLVFQTITRERLRPEDAPALPEALDFDQRRIGVGAASAPLSGLSFSAELSSGTAINLSPPAGERPALADSRTAALTVSVRPTPPLAIDTTYLWTGLTARRSDAAIFGNRILRSRWNYQITRRLSARAIARCERLSIDSLQSSLAPRRDVIVDLLVTYLVQPGTALYVGVNTDRQSVPRDRAERVFVKMSYRFQL